MPQPDPSAVNMLRLFMPSCSKCGASTSEDDDTHDKQAVLAWAILDENPGSIRFVAELITIASRTDSWGGSADHMLLDPEGRFHACLDGLVFENEGEVVASSEKLKALAQERREAELDEDEEEDEEEDDEVETQPRASCKSKKERACHHKWRVLSTYWECAPVLLSAQSRNVRPK